LTQFFGSFGEQHPPSLNLLNWDNCVRTLDASTSECFLGLAMQFSVWIGLI